MRTRNNYWVFFTIKNIKYKKEFLLFSSDKIAVQNYLFTCGLIVYTYFCLVRLKTPSANLSEGDWLHVPLEAIDGRAAYECLRVPKSDVIREE